MLKFRDARRGGQAGGEIFNKGHFLINIQGFCKAHGVWEIKQFCFSLNINLCLISDVIVVVNL